ncbi:MAG: alpha/beta hydrolase [Candidatus Ozemobacteraceae bacterium]
MARQEIPTQTVEILGVSVSYLEVGTGHPLLFLHGAPGCKEAWVPLALSLSAVGFRCILIDRPGYGATPAIPTQSSTNPLESDPGSAQFELLSLFIEKVVGQAAGIIAYSIGCFTALRLAARKPECVAVLGLIAPYVYPKDASVKHSYLPAVSQMPILGSLAKLIMPYFWTRTLQAHIESAFYPLKLEPEKAQRAQERYSGFANLVSVHLDINDFLANQEELHEFPGRTGTKIQVPAILVGASKDAICDGQAEVNKAAATLANPATAMIGNGGHALPYTHVPRLMEILPMHLKKAFSEREQFSGNDALSPVANPLQHNKSQV